MKQKREKNIEIFNDDVKKGGGYVYTDVKILSAYIASLKQSEEIIGLVKKVAGKKKDITIIDIGSGDGTYTFELLEKIKPKNIVGFDVARDAVRIANKKIKKKDRGRIKFVQSSIYDADRVIKQKFDIAVIRGVLHHLYKPTDGIDAISKLSDKFIVVEPNGYNPILKVIEKVSPYHRKHEEKSYFPHLLNKWFTKNGFKVKHQHYFGVVPFFCPPLMARFLKKYEPVFENLPYINRIYCASNAVIYER